MLIHIIIIVIIIILNNYIILIIPQGITSICIFHIYFVDFQVKRGGSQKNSISFTESIKISE